MEMGWNVQDEAVKRAQMIMTFRGHALDWYMKLSLVPAGNPKMFLDHIQTKLINEFKKPKYDSKCIKIFKEIKKTSSEFV